MLVRRIDAVSIGDVDAVGGKGASLGALTRAGFAVPDGFILTTEAYALAARAARLDPRDPGTGAERLRTSAVPDAVAAAAREAYAALGGGPVAVRSSATAEDLPGASFAGQQDSYLDVAGEAALLDAVRRCWASLWNERAIAYRRANAVDDAGVAIAVVVQRMVDASVAGVLFTADPITGRRRHAAIDAVAGLGDRLVSGAVDPEHYAVDAAAGRVAARPAGGGQPLLADDELLALAAVGDRVERDLGGPQDIEFALDRERRPWLVQSRPITTLYPLPDGAPDPERDLRVYFSANVFQGYFDPITPMGVQFFRLLGSAAARGFGADVADAVAGPPVLVEAGMRLYADVTPVVRDRVGRRLIVAMLGMGEARSSVVLARLGSDPRLPLSGSSRPRTLRRLAGALRHAGVAHNAARVLRSPDAGRERCLRGLDELARVELPPGADAAARLDAFERLLTDTPPRILPRLFGVILPAMLSLITARRLLRGRARDDEVQTVTRGAPHNPTTEMDLALWAAAMELRADPESRAALLERTPPELAAAYRAGALPARLRDALSSFLARYGFRSIGEIDIGVERWSEDPTHILGALANYVRLGDGALAPDEQFARGEREAEAMVGALLGRVHGPRRFLLRLALRRVRALIGAREAPKFHLIRLVATPARELLRSAGAELAANERIAAADGRRLLPDAARGAAGGRRRGPARDRGGAPRHVRA